MAAEAPKKIPKLSNENSKKVGILGTGNVGQAIGRGLIAEGHSVLLSGREAGNEKAVAWAAANGERASAGSFNDAAKFGEIVVFAVNGQWTAIEGALAAAGPENLAGKIVIDVVNPLEFGPSGPGLAVGPNGVSVTEWLQAAVPTAKVVKALNTINCSNFYQPRFVGGADLHIAGDDAEAKAAVRSILNSFGWEKDGHRILDFGGAKAGRELEYVALLFVKYALATKDWSHGIRFVKDKHPAPQ